MTEHPQEHVILGILMARDRHGYEIHRYFSAGLGRVWHAGISQVYALLKRLEAAEKVVSTVEMQNNRPAKHIFSITPKGREKFLQWIHTPLEKIRDLRLEFLAKLFFTRELRLTGIDELIGKQMLAFREQLRDINQKDENCNDAFDHLVYQFRIVQLEAVLAWLHECKKSFNEDSQ
jgi:PadR family transcriptional regulator AphA